MSMFGEIAEEATWKHAAAIALKKARDVHAGYPYAKKFLPITYPEKEQVLAHMRGQIMAAAVLAIRFRKESRQVR